MATSLYAAKPYFETNSHALSSRYPTLLNHNDWMKQRPDPPAVRATGRGLPSAPRGSWRVQMADTILGPAGFPGECPPICFRGTVALAVGIVFE
jgi:hypothetical protein